MIYYGNELYHHGIKGQKWGDRNYQYEDGSLTPEGKKRYGVGKGYDKAKYKDARRALKQKEKKLSFDALDVLGTRAAKLEMKKAEVAAMKGDKKEFKSIVKSMERYGQKGSLNDNINGKAATKLYNEVKKKKGKQYADKAMQSAKNRTVAKLVGSSALTVGSAIAAAYFTKKELS